MNTIAPQDRRFAYRFKPPVVLEPIFSIIYDCQRIRASSVIDINVRGARVSFKQIHHFNPGQVVTASIQAPGLDGCVDIPSRVVFSANQKDEHILAMVFTELPDFDNRADANCFTVFNRRQDQRKDVGRNVSAVLLNDSSTPTEETGIEVRVVNHTRNGIGFVVNLALDRMLDGREAIKLAVQTSEEPDPQRITARVLHRAVRSDAVYYGCMYNHA